MQDKISEVTDLTFPKTTHFSNSMFFYSRATFYWGKYIYITINGRFYTSNNNVKSSYMRAS